MAKFCMYCGKPLNGGTCDCPQAVAEAEKKARMKVQAAMQAARGGAAQPQNQQAAQIQYQQPVQPQYQQSAHSAQQQAAAAQAAQQQTAGGKQIQITAPSAEQAAAVGKDVKNLFTGLFTAPVETMRQAAASANKIPQYLMAAVEMAVAMILLACVTGKKFFGWRHLIWIRPQDGDRCSDSQGGLWCGCLCVGKETQSGADDWHSNGRICTDFCI